MEIEKVENQQVNIIFFLYFVIFLTNLYKSRQTKKKNRKKLGKI